MRKRYAAVVAITTAASFLAACETVPAGDSGGMAANPENTSILARGWEMPKDTGVTAGAISVRDAHELVAVEPPDADRIETADIPPPGQAGSLSGNPASRSVVDPAETAEIIVRSLLR